MSINTYEIHNSYLHDAPDSTGITRMVSEADYLSQLQQTDALQTSLNNIINAFGIKGEGAHSKLVIKYVHGLVAENEVLKAFRPQPNGAAMMEALDVFEAGYDEYPEGAMFDAFEILCCKRVSTPATDAAIAEIKAQGVDELIQILSVNGYMDDSEPLIQGEIVEFAANLRAGRKG